ncbi:hypothetical protein C7999DRAFT_41389 [Corynascus novoguineensis]|uniref:Aminoglycoside phosphotransferase domain-containing protein n=1 Tax=Corynascus novoguineensis TaxID=1126955 RepID=A0AAN7CRZ6_9PEZI|nr:hypothetical protein C7999DRAFT_41389 [Corynascus novoguineensis]
MSIKLRQLFSYPAYLINFLGRKLPFGLYLKYRGIADLARNEFNAMRTLHLKTTIPIPEPLDVIPNGDSSYLLMTRLPGRSSQTVICNTFGEICRHHRICSVDPIGPFSDEPSRRGHKMAFPLADLNPRNILVDQVTLSDGTTGWRVTGIVDWETAGYYPEYWDYTKALFKGFRWKPRYIKMVHKVFE